MNRQVGMWIDHRRAVIVSLEDGGRERVEIVESDLKRLPRPVGGSRSKTPYGPQDVMKEDGWQRKIKARLAHYYDRVLEHIGQPEALYLFGPGMAKLEFKDHIRDPDLRGRIAAIETTDKLTDPQIAAKVRAFFGHATSPIGTPAS